MTGFTPVRLTGFAVAAAGLALAAAIPAQAQDGYKKIAYDPAYDQPGYDVNGAYTTEGVTVMAPREERSPTTGARIRTHYASRVVPVADLDPDSPRDARILKVRIERAARSACDELDARYPVTSISNIEVDNTPPCVSRTVQRSMAQAVDAFGYVPAGW